MATCSSDFIPTTKICHCLSPGIEATTSFAAVASIIQPLRHQQAAPASCWDPVPSCQTRRQLPCVLTGTGCLRWVWLNGTHYLLSAGKELNWEQGAKYLHALRSSQDGKLSMRESPEEGMTQGNAIEPLRRDVLWEVRWFGKAGWEVVMCGKSKVHLVHVDRQARAGRCWQQMNSSHTGFPSSGDAVSISVSPSWVQPLVGIQSKA